MFWDFFYTAGKTQYTYIVGKKKRKRHMYLLGPCKVRNETETKHIETKRNKTRRNETKYVK
jgi:hypothetical protein